MRKLKGTARGLCSWLGLFSAVRDGVPGVNLFLSRLAPRVEGVVHHHTCLQHLVVVLEITRQPERDRGEPGRLGREIQPRGIRSADDKGELLERRIREAVVLAERIKPAAPPFVRKEDAATAARRATALFGTA